MVATLLAWGIYPLWLLAGAADLWCHRRTDLRHTSGVAESAFHLAQLGVIGIAALAFLTLDVTTTIFAFMVALVASHSVLAFLDVAYTDARRPISPTEQHIHAYLEVLPWTALLCVAVLEWPAIAAPDFAVRRREALTGINVLGVLAPAALVAMLPAILEFAGAWRERLRAGRNHPATETGS